MPNKSTNPDATLMIVVDKVDPPTDPKTYQYVYVGNINGLPSDVLTEGSIVNIPGIDLKSVMSQKGATDLVSEYNVSTNNNNTEYTFAQAVVLVPASLQKGGLTIKYIDSTTHEYVIKRLMSSTWNTTESNWQGIDDKPTVGSENLVKSGGAYNAITALRNDLLEGDIIPAMAETLAPWADQKAIATPDTYTDAVRTTGGDIPVETSAGSKPESIKPVSGSKWTAKLLFNGSYNMLNAAKWGAANSQPYVGGVGSDFVYFLVPELTLGTFGTADDNNGLLFTDSDGENVEPTSVYFKPLGATVPSSLTDGTSITSTSVSYDGKTYKDYATNGAGWLIVPKTIYDNDVCAHIAWEDWYDKYVSLNEPTTNPEAVVGILMLESLLALAHSDKYLRGVNDAVCDNVVFDDTSATITHMVEEFSVAANAWTNTPTGESDSQGNALYRHSATISGIKQGGAACVERENGGISLTVNGTTVSYVDTNATAPAGMVFYEVTATSTTKAYTDNIFSGSNINTETGVLPINDCSIEAQVAMGGKANITVKYAKNIVDQVAINATVDVPQIKNEVEEHEKRITELEDTAVKTNSYDASVSVGLADNLRGDTVVNAEFYKRKTGGTQSVGSGIAAIKEVRGKSIVWNSLFRLRSSAAGTYNDVVVTIDNNRVSIVGTNNGADANVTISLDSAIVTPNHKWLFKMFSSGWIGQTNNIFVQKIGNGTNVYLGDNAEKKIVKIPSNWSGGSWCVVIPIISGKTYNFSFTPQIYDLTLMFGVNNEPTIEEFEKRFPLEYYDYNSGNVIPFAGQNLTTTGKNQYNPATGKANLLGGQTYQLLGTYTGAEIDGVAVTLDSNNCFTTTNDCVLDITGGNDINTFVGIYNGETNTFEPYEKHTLPLDPSQWRDKQGNFVFPYGGMFGYGSAYDYAKVDADGYIHKAVRVYERRAYESGDVTSNNVITDGKTYTFYPLETPVEVELATPAYAKYLVDKDGTEEITPTNGTNPYTTMANLSILYAMDARGEIKNLPKNYLSKESAESMLNALVTAGIIASYTMTWDAANSRYIFTFVAPTPEPQESNN